MKTRIFFTLLLSLIGVEVTNATNLKSVDDKITKEYKLKDFNGIEASGIGNIQYTQGKEFQVKVEGDYRLIERLEVSVKDSKLIIKYKRISGNIGNVKAPVFHITSPQLTGIDLSGAAQFQADVIQSDKFDIDTSGATTIRIGTLKCKRADVEASGATKIYGKIVAENVGVDCSGATQGEVEIEADKFDLDASGATSMTYVFKGKNIDIEQSGAGTIDLTVDCQWLRAENSGVAKLNISGAADDVKIEGSGVSKINTSNLNKF